MRTSLKKRPFRVAAVCAVVVWGWHGASASLPVSENFETLSGTPSDSGAVEYIGARTVVTDVALQGNKALKLASAEFDQGAIKLLANQDSSNPENVWALIYTIPARGDDDTFLPVANDVAFAFGVYTNDKLQVYAGAGWQELDLVVPAGWIGFVVNADYSKEMWDLYLATDGVYGTDLTRVGTNLLFNATYGGSAFMTELRIESDIETWVDALALQVSRLPVDGIADVGYDKVAISPRQTGLFVSLPPENYAGGAARTFAGQLGDDMKSGLNNDDEVRLLDKAVGDWVSYTLNGVWGGGSTNIQFDLGQGVVLAKITKTGMAFLPYKVLPAWGGTAVAATLNATDDESAGWNILAWPKSDAKPEDSNEWGFDAADLLENGDRMLVFDEITGRTYTFQWNGTQWRNFPNNTVRADYVLRKGQGFWLRRRNSIASNPNWMP